MTIKIVFVIFLVIAAGVVLYLVQSGIVGQGLRALVAPFHHSSSSGSFFISPLTAASSTGTGSATSPAPNQTQISQAPTTFTTTTPAAKPTGQWIGIDTTSIPPSQIPKGFTASQLSPFFHAVRLSSVSYGSFTHYGQIWLSAGRFPASTTIDITGWQIKARNGGEYIPQAVNFYDPSGLMPASDIFFKNTDSVHLYSSAGPFNLRLNECIGYIGKENHFTPPLPASCPTFNRSKIQYLSGVCQNYINSLTGCALPDLNKAPIPYTDYNCINYLSNINYKGCLDAHEGDANFLSNQIWVWTGSNIVDQYHDTVELLDRSGLLVDVYTY